MLCYWSEAACDDKYSLRRTANVRTLARSCTPSNTVTAECRGCPVGLKVIGSRCRRSMNSAMFLSNLCRSIRSNIPNQPIQVFKRSSRQRLRYNGNCCHGNGYMVSRYSRSEVPLNGRHFGVYIYIYILKIAPDDVRTLTYECFRSALRRSPTGSPPAVAGARCNRRNRPTALRSAHRLASIVHTCRLVCFPRNLCGRVI